MEVKVAEMIGKVTEIKDAAHWEAVLKAAESKPVSILLLRD